MSELSIYNPINALTVYKIAVHVHKVEKRVVRKGAFTYKGQTYRIEDNANPSGKARVLVDRDGRVLGIALNDCLWNVWREFR